VRKVGVTFRFNKKSIPYAEALRSVGLEPVAITPETPRSLDGLDGLVITGGTDLDPSLYGQAPHPEAETPDRERDALESALLLDAIERDVPMLGICRGCQLLNVLHGGTLVQHLPETPTHRVRPPETELGMPAHAVEIKPGTRLGDAVGASEHQVNSRHHQAVDRLGDGLQVTAVAPDGVVEALERPDRRFIVAVQWHPENSVAHDEVNRRLFQAFARAVNER